MSLSPLTFTGVSSLSNDLQSVLTRAVSIASLPLQRLQNQDTDILEKKTLLGAMGAPIVDLGSAVTALGNIASKRAIGASSSNSEKVAVMNAGASAAALYTITGITSLAAAAGETSVASYPDSDATTVSANGSMRLVAGGETFNFTLTDNNLAGLRDKINSLGAGVNASILTTEGGNYLSVSASATGATTLRLIDDPDGANSDLLTSNNQGSNAQFKLNGIPISRASNAVNDVVPGLTFTILDTTEAGESVKLTLATDRSQLSQAIGDFVSAYNAVLEQVNRQIGPNAGLLSGDFLVREVQNDLRALGSYETSGAIKNLAGMGIYFDSSGQVSFDSSKFSLLSDAEVSGAFDFFGSSTTGFGALAKKFTSLTDPVTGLIKLQQDSYDATDRRLQNEIEAMTDRIEAMQQSVAARLQLADQLLAQLESQQTVLDASIKSVTYALYGKQTDN